MYAIRSYYVFYQLNQAPAPLLDLAGALSYQTLATAAQLDLFRVLGRGPMTPARNNFV